MSELLEPGHERADMRMIEMAVNRGWKIPEAALEYLPKKLLQIASKGSDEIAIKAGALLLKLAQFNFDTEHPVQQHQHLHAVITTPEAAATLEQRRAKIAGIIARIG